MSASFPGAPAQAPTRSWLQPDMLAPKDHRPWPWGPRPGLPGSGEQRGLEPQAYGLIMADPPWPFQNYSEKGEAKGPRAHYDTMSLEQIGALPVGDLARADCWLWCWCTWPLLNRQLRIIEQAWGFEHVTGGAWDKRRWGTGYVIRSRCEPFIIAKRGKPAADGASVCNVIEGGAREHSRKPDAAYATAATIAGDVRRCSLFEREPRPGWDGWGNEYGQPIERERRKRKATEQAEPPALLATMGA